MSTVSEIEAAIQKLPPADYRELLTWIEERQVTVGASETLFAMYDDEDERPAEDGQKGTVTGEVQEISFIERKLTILYLPRNRSLECFYDEELEPMLFENRRGLIQVTGKVIMDDENHPRKIVEVDQIQELDLSPITLSKVRADSVSLQLKEPLMLKPALSDSQQLISLSYEKLDIDVFAPTRAELFAELSEQVIMLWQEYAQEDDAKLSDSALSLKRRLQSSFVPEEH